MSKEESLTNATGPCNSKFDFPPTPNAESGGEKNQTPFWFSPTNDFNGRVARYLAADPQNANSPTSSECILVYSSSTSSTLGAAWAAGTLLPKLEASLEAAAGEVAVLVAVLGADGVVDGFSALPFWVLPLLFASLDFFDFFLLTADDESVFLPPFFLSCPRVKVYQ